MTTLTVRPVEPHEFDSWDEFVEGSPQGTIFHTSRWKRVVDRACAPARLVLLGCYDPYTLVGGCVIMDRERMGQRTAVMPLATPYLGFLLENPLGEKISDIVSRQHEIIGALAAEMTRGYDYLNLSNSPAFDDTRPLIQAGYRLTPRFTYLLNLRLHPEELWQRMDGSVRRQIRKGERLGFDISDNLHPAEAYGVLRATFERRGEECPIAEKLFTDIVEAEHLRDSRSVFCARDGDRLVSFVVLLGFARTQYYALAATEPDSLANGVSPLLVWEAVKSCAAGDWNALDFVGANIPSIARFKEGFNPRLQIYFQAEYFGSSLLRLGKSLVDLVRR